MTIDRNPHRKTWHFGLRRREPESRLRRRCVVVQGRREHDVVEHVLVRPRLDDDLRDCNGCYCSGTYEKS